MLKSDVEESKKEIAKIVESVEATGQRMDEAFGKAGNNMQEAINQLSQNAQRVIKGIPDIDLRLITNVPQKSEDIDAAFTMIGRSIRANEEAIKNLKGEYQQLTEKINLYRNVPSKRDEVKELIVQRATLKEVIGFRQQLIDKVKTLVPIVEQSEQAFRKEATTQNEVKKRIREIIAEMGALRAAAMQNGQALDESTGRYRELVEELGQLKDIQGDIAKQGQILANDENTYQGIAEGLSGVSGGFTAATGAMALFGQENEDLQKVMTKLQAVMAITMGLQQVQQTLNKDSAFRLVTLNNLKKTWNKILAAGRGELMAENAALATNKAAHVVKTAATTADATATGASTAASAANSAAEGVNAGATTADAAAKKAKAAASGQAAVAEGADTAATAANATVAVAGTGANIGLAGAFRMVGAAIKSIPVFGWIAAAIGALIGVVNHFASAAKKARQEQQRVNDVIGDSYGEYKKAEIQLKQNIKKVNEFNGTQEEEEELVNALNEQYGEQLGHYKSKEKWQRVLAERGKDYCDYLLLEAQHQALVNAQVEAYVRLQKLSAQDAEDVDGAVSSIWMKVLAGSAGLAGLVANVTGLTDRAVQSYNQSNKDDAEAELNREMKVYEDAAKKLEPRMKELQDRMKLRVEVEDEEANPRNRPERNPNPHSRETRKAQYDAEEAARQRRKIEYDYAQNVAQYILEARQIIEDAQNEGAEQNLDTQLLALQQQTDRRIQALKDSYKQLALINRDMERDWYMESEGATEAGWEGQSREWDATTSNADGTTTTTHVVKTVVDMTDDDWTQYYASLSDAREAAELFEQELTLIRQNGQIARDRLLKQHFDQFVQQYGTVEQKIAALTEQEDKAIAEIPIEIKSDPAALQAATNLIHKFFERQKVELEVKANVDSLKEELNWEEVFGNLNALATPALKRLKTTIREWVKSNKDLTPEAARQIMEAVEKIDAQITAREPFKALGDSMKNLRTTTKELKDAQKEYNRAMKEGSAEEQANAEKALRAARAAKQQALAEATKAVQGTIKQLQEYMGAANALVDCLEGFGVEMPEELKGFLGGISDALAGLESMDLTRPFSLITGLIKGIGGIGKAIGSLFNHDGSKEKRIAKLDEQIKDLDHAYDQLQKSMDKAYSAEAAGLLKKQNQLLEQKRAAIEAQIAEEESKKDSDNSRIAEWRKEIDNINAAIADNKEAMVDAIFGEDVKSAINNFADAYASMFDEGISKARASKNLVRDMIKKMILEALKADLSAPMERVREMLNGYFADGVISDWEEKAVEGYVEGVMEEQAAKWGWADKYLKEANGQDGGTRGGFTAMSQDSADELNGRFTAIQMDSAAMRADVAASRNALENINTMLLPAGVNIAQTKQYVDEIRGMSLIAIDHLETISKNTHELFQMNERLGKIEKYTSRL